MLLHHGLNPVGNLLENRPRVNVLLTELSYLLKDQHAALVALIESVMRMSDGRCQSILNGAREGALGRGSASLRRAEANTLGDHRRRAEQIVQIACMGSLVLTFARKALLGRLTTLNKLIWPSACTRRPEATLYFLIFILKTILAFIIIANNIELLHEGVPLLGALDCQSGRFVALS